MAEPLIADAPFLRLHNAVEHAILNASHPDGFDPHTMVFAVTGGRSYTDRRAIYAALSTVDSIAYQYGFRALCVVHGACPSGLDCLASQWVRDSRLIPVRTDPNRVSEIRFPADWKRHGPSAGPKRNHQMLVEARPRFLLHWPGGKGTDNCKVNAKILGIPVIDALPHIPVPVDVL